MIEVIAVPAEPQYRGGMRLIMLKLIALMAVLLMPLGMSEASAAGHHTASVSAPAQHCPDRSPNHEMKGGIAECTMVCAAALPAADGTREIPHLRAGSPAVLPAEQRMDGIVPEIATPPPKLS
jgi:hypothetical protein